MGKRNSKGGAKKSKSKKRREKKSKANVSTKEEKNSQKAEDDSDINTEQVRPLPDDLSNIFFSSTSKTSSDTDSETNATDTTNTADINDCCEEIKAKQQEMFDKLKNLTEALAALTLIRDNVNSIRVDTLTELYFTRQVRPLLDALNIISFAFSNMTSGAQNIQINTFGDRKEIRHALNLSYKMNDEVEDIINTLGRRLKIFINQIDKIDKNCPPFDFNKDS